MSSKRRARALIITMDVEPDLTRYLTESYHGIESIPKFLQILSKNDIKCDFFITANIAKTFPNIVKNIAKGNHYIGNHGMDHKTPYYCKKSIKWQKDEISKSTEILENATGKKITMFRAPNFSANGNTITVLESMGYNIDSSVLPGRRLRYKRIIPIYDFRNVSPTPYLPSSEDIRKSGKSSILEIPLTGNPELPGRPIGVGYLNHHGVEKTLSLIDKVKSEYVTFLMHPWENINLGRYHPQLPEGWKAGCKDNIDEISRLIKELKKSCEFINLHDIFSEYS